VRLYLDGMIPPAVAVALRDGGADAVAAAECDALGLCDAAQLARAIHEERALVTYDVRDYVLLARAAASAGRAHWGIVLVAARTIPPSDIGGLVRALQALLAERPAPDALKNQTVFLRPPAPPPA
jgi:predicted nuclease of predicted toxin-antitoxin system